MAGPERIMAENIPGATEATSPTTLLATPTRELPIYKSPEFDPNRKDYQTRAIGKDVIFIDPLTGAEVARLPKIEGGAGPAIVEKLGFTKEGISVWSPDFEKIGIDIAENIVELEEKPYQIKYADNGQALDLLYQQWKDWVAKKGEQSITRKPLKSPEESEVTQTVPEESNIPDNLDGIDTFESVRRDYTALRGTRPRTPEQQAELNDAEAKLSRCFNEARRMGLLYGIDKSLKEVYEDIMQGIEAGYGQRRRLSPAETLARAETAKGQISLLGQRTFQTLLMRSNLEDTHLDKIAKLEGVWDFYAELATGRFALLLNGGGLVQPPTIAGEFTFKLDDLNPKEAEEFRKLSEDREVYWHPTYANYFEVTAKTPEHFETAVDSFTQWIRSGLSKSPNEIFQRVNGFKDALTTAAVRERANITTDFIAGLRRELEGLVGILGADWANEHYNADYYKQFLTFAAQDEGPGRFVRLSRANRGKVAAVLWKFDKDPRFELFFSPHGSRGQLMKERNPVEQRELIEQIKAILIAEIMGVNIKEYYPGDSEKRSGYLEGNLNEIAKFKSDEGFKDLFEGFDQKDQGTIYKELNDKQAQINSQIDWAKQIQQRFGQSNMAAEDIQLYLGPEGYQLYEQYIRGELALKPAEQALLKRLERATRIQADLKDGKDPEELKGEYKAMYEEAKSAFTLAYELYGAMGEKAKRSGGAFLVDREVQGRKFVDYMPIHWAEKFVQFAENWTKAKYGDLPAAEVKNRVAQARKMAIAAIKKDGFDAKLFDITFSKDGQIIDPETFLGLDQYKQPLHPNVIGYTKDGQPVTFFALFSKKDNPPEIYDKPTGSNRQRIVFNNLGQMLLKGPKLKPDGSIDVEEKKVDFQTAVNHIYSRWTGHPYWGYQEEDTGLLLSRESFTQAKLIKEGKLRPEDAKPHAVQLLIVDPTLKRVMHFPDRESREDKIVLAAVEDSYQSHWRITDQLYQAFYPADADDEYNRIAYVLQDQGGSTKEWFHARAEAARWTNMKTRRLRTMIPVLPLHFTSMVEMWGAGTTLDVFRMMNYKQYRMVGQFALEKWINQTEAAQDLYEALFGFVDAQGKRSREGLGEKPVNDADALQKWSKQVSTGDLGNIPGRPSTSEEVDNQFVNAVRESLGRFEAVFHKIRVLETDKRGERTPLWLEGIDIFLKEDLIDKKTGKTLAKKGDFNPQIDKLDDVGSARHSGEIFFWRFVKWLRSDKEGEGQALYPTEALYYELMDQPTLASQRAVKDEVIKAKLLTRWDWLLAKLNR